MPTETARLTQTGLSTTAGYAQWFPDLTQSPPFAVSVAITASTSGNTFNVQYSQDYTGSSAFYSSAATWFVSTAVSTAGAPAAGTITFPVSALRLNVASGSSQSTYAMTVVQSG